MEISFVSHKRGFELDDYPGSFTFVLIKEAIDSVSDALATLLGKPLIKDAYRNYDRIGSDGILIWQYVGHCWTLFVKYRMRSEEVSQTLSASLSTDCIHYSYESVSGWQGYQIFRNGEAVETYSFGIDYRPDWIEFYYGSAEKMPVETDHGIPWDINATDENGYQFLCRSILRSISAGEVKNVKEFLNNCFVNQDAWLPSAAYMPLPTMGFPAALKSTFVRVDWLDSH